MQNISSNNQTPSYKGHPSIVVILSNSPRWPLYRGRSKRGGVRAPPKIGKNMIFFGTKSWFFKRNTPKIFAPPSAMGENKIVWRKIVIYQHATSTIYPNISRTQIQHDNQPLNVCGNNQYFTFYINRTSVALFTKIRNYSPNFFT